MNFAASGEEALDRLSEEIQPALVAVLSDINMPGMDGLELLGEIKQRRPDLPVMMVTVRPVVPVSDADLLHRAMRASGEVTFKDLFEGVRLVFSEKELRDLLEAPACRCPSEDPPRSVIFPRVVSRVDVVDASWANELDLQDRLFIPGPRVVRMSCRVHPQ
jgi:CheY-like chemotaxis protein